ncbi:calcium-translocating P-type ATPase, SERCA-type [Candidatus Woesearchaeota archaeon]|nr:calcium-translocating P-type ATPase, SERCA-type [Candidatus Woesearchaeota archaeon]
MMLYYDEEIKEVFKELNTSEKGISSSEAEKRLEKYGLNELKEGKKISPLRIFLQQFASPIVWVLIGAFIISLVIKEEADAVIIGFIVVVNAIVGFIQEYKADKAIEALKKMASLKATVIRDGKQQQIDATNLVPGDIVILTTGEKIPADARLIEAVNLQTQEAALTGESLPIKKVTKVFKKDTPVADRKNMVFSGTIITDGRGKAIVTETGMSTELGKIANLIQKAKPGLTPLQKNLDKIGKLLTVVVLIVCALVFVLGVVRGQMIKDSFFTAIALAVAAIPEGLPAVVTISLALGVQRMIKRHALIRKLPSVETLGGCTVICSDKTGTLTHNEMTVRKLLANNEVIETTGAGYEPEGKFSKDPKNFELLLKIGALNNDAKHTKEKEKCQIFGDPTEGCLIVSAKKAGLDTEKLLKENPRTSEIQFSSERKRMTTIHKVNGKRVAYMKGAPDVILKLCDKILINGKIRKINDKDKKKILKTNDEFASEALRVLGFAYKELKNEKKDKDIENKLIFVGLQGMIDPPRKEVKDSVKRCMEAGIKVVMITGDFIGTAKAIAKELGIKGKAITGEDLDKIKDLEKRVEGIGIYARVNPEHKMKIVNALKAKGHIVAMTGDGVNDAPALKKSDIGVAMGITGTDVSKEASDMILTDDNFTSIVNAVEEGRGIYDNIKKFVNYLLSSNMGEVLVLLVAMIIGFSIGGAPAIPLIAIHILWINFVTDVFPALALGVDPSSPGIMKRKPRNTKEHIITANMAWNIIIIGILMCASALFLFSKYYTTDLVKAQTVVFTTLVVLEVVRLYMIRSQYHVGFFSNKFLLLAIISSISLQLVVVYTRLNKFFKVSPLGITEWAYIIGATIIVFIVGMMSTAVIKRVTKEAD